MKNNNIQVTSHVARDFLQNSTYFNSLSKVLWEYISNSLDNSKDGIQPYIIVDYFDDNLKIIDNGIGMSHDDLMRFFQMHGENIQRKKGKTVRGRFGTGKCAAFGIASVLRIDTVQDNKRDIVELTIDMIKAAADGKPFGVNQIVLNEITDQENGTVVQISKFFNKKIDFEKAISYIEKHLGRFRVKAQVLINGHLCKYKEPPFINEYVIKSSEEIKKFIGNVDLTIRVSPIPLDSEEQGIDVLSNGIWHETTLCGLENKDQTNRIFGCVDVPIFENDVDNIPPFDNTRSNLLNRANSRVVVLIAWITEEIEKIRKKLVEVENKKRENEEIKNLQKKAKQIEDILNEDFQNVMEELELAKLIRRRKISTFAESGDGVVIPNDGDQKSQWQNSGRSHGDNKTESKKLGEGEIPRKDGSTLIPGDQKGSTMSPSKSGIKKYRNTFSLKFEHLTEEEYRSKYVKDACTIYINLDHLQVASILKSNNYSFESKQFLEIAYEIATVEYAQAVQYERLSKGEEIPVEDALFNVRDIIDRLTRKFALIFS